MTREQTNFYRRPPKGACRTYHTCHRAPGRLPPICTGVLANPKHWGHPKVLAMPRPILPKMPKASGTRSCSPLVGGVEATDAEDKGTVRVVPQGPFVRLGNVAGFTVKVP